MTIADYRRTVEELAAVARLHCYGSLHPWPVRERPDGTTIARWRHELAARCPGRVFRLTPAS